MISERQEIRQAAGARRSALSREERWHKALLATHALGQHRIFRTASNIALYVAVGAECPSLPLSVAAEASGKSLHYPRTSLRQHGQMHFVHVHSHSTWHEGRFGIPEPDPCSRYDIVNPRRLDMIVLPLVAFDREGNRLGMGAGYYDRCLAFRRHRRHWRRPLLVGLAYDCQQTDRIPAQAWDVPLDAVATESGFKHFKR